jgi:hypothetical protein
MPFAKQRLWTWSWITCKCRSIEWSSAKNNLWLIPRGRFSRVSSILDMGWENEISRQAIQDNQFHSEYFAWIEVGYCRTKNYSNKQMLQQFPATLQYDQPIHLILVISGIGNDKVRWVWFHTLCYDILDAIKNKLIGKVQDWLLKHFLKMLGCQNVINIVLHNMFLISYLIN